ncbi:ABC transporter substrate-binding protein [Kurthia sibirica]|uniref:Amino acid-binding protein n=1 Tax=Kurthia sibirica TaxID=202750 RepID=A0A2U3ANT8_9BACL|nr:ABC transporter substrate-binding protein [Kurthia sibirica]PWI26213.1 amino acid-binding protein [Kurthia sibirica]GEK34727.1 ABC transporter ATP-binding protein [Kurthia sibirica]
MKKISYLLGFFIAAVLLTACNEQADTRNELRIGAVFPKTGPLALLGIESYRGVVLAVDEVNATGGINGKKIKLVGADALDPDKATSEATRLLTKEKVKLLVGSYSSGISFAASEVVERNNALYFELGAIADNITSRGYQSIIRINPVASSFSKLHIRFIEEVIAKKLNKNIKDIKVAIVHEDSSYGTTIADSAVELGKEKNMQIVSLQSYSATTNDLNAVIINLLKQKPEVIISAAYINDAILFSKQSEELGYKIPYLLGTGGGHALQDYKKSVGELSEGVFSVGLPEFNMNSTYSPGRVKFIEAYKKKYNAQPQSGHSLSNYVSMQIVLQTLKNAKSEEPKKVREAAVQLKLEKGTTANGWGVDIDEKTGQNRAADPYLTEWVGGQLITVFPEEVAVSKIVWK